MCVFCRIARPVDHIAQNYISQSNLPLDERVLVLLLTGKSPIGKLSVGQLDELVSVAHGLLVWVARQSSGDFFGAVGSVGTTALIVNSRSRR